MSNNTLNTSFYNQCTISVVSHGHDNQLQDIVLELRSKGFKNFVITQNLREHRDFIELADPNTKIIINEVKKGYGANHNLAFSYCRTKYFIIANPDISISNIDTVKLENVLSLPFVGLVGPSIISSDNIEIDSPREKINLFKLVKRVLNIRKPQLPPIMNQPCDWVPGMCMIVKSEDFKNARGFDERYFMYCEDVVLSKRIKGLGKEVIFSKHVQCVHNGNRAYRSSLKHLYWHIRSMSRLLIVDS